MADASPKNKNLISTNIVRNDQWKLELWRRDFSANLHPRSSKTRNELNCDSLTSEFYPSEKFAVVVRINATDKHSARVELSRFKTRKAAQMFIDREIEDERHRVTVEEV